MGGPFPGNPYGKRREVAVLLEIAICDDEKLVIERIRNLIEGQRVGCRIEAFATGRELLASGKRFDLIFLDIQMAGLNGIETARALRKRDRKAVLIFVTAVKEYVFDAFDVGAFHYLLKPVGEEKFAEVFANALREIRQRQPGRKEPALFLKTRQRSYTLKQSGILFIESRGRKAVVHTAGDTLEVYAVMKELEAQLGDCFYRCHRGYLVNMAHIAEYDSGMIEMDNGEQVYLAKEKYPGFVRAYMRYLRNGGAAGE